MTSVRPESGALRGLEAALEDAAAWWKARRALRREIQAAELLGRLGEEWVAEVVERVAATGRTLRDLLAVPVGDRDSWIERQPWTADVLALGERLLDEAEVLPVADRLDLARLAARVAVRTPGTRANLLLKLRVDDVVGRAGLLEVRALRRRGQLAAASERFADLQALFSDDRTPFYFWLTLAADSSLTAGLLARDDGRLPAASAAFHRAAKLFRIAGSEEDDFDLVCAQARTDLLRGDASRAVDRLTPAPAFQDHGRRVAIGFLRLHAALRTTSPLLARHAALGLLVELGSARPRQELDHFRIAEAAVRLAEGQPTGALEAVGGPAESLRAEGSLLGSLRAALVACRAELARRRPRQARAALAAGVLEAFTDLPDLPSVRAVLGAVAEHARGRLDDRFLDRLDLWLALAEDSPGVGLPESPRITLGRPRGAAPAPCPA